MMSDVYVFIGPTISSGEAKQYLNANYLPPVSQGDVSSLLRRKPKVIGIIDGYFECVPSVWHKEILLALSEGVHVVGGGSLGALRAAELHPFGMVGIGRIFQWYRDGTIEADDEVAIQHASEEFAFKALSDALVNIRATLQQAREQAVISPSMETALLALGQMMHYTERSYPRILKAGLEAGLPPEEISALEQFIRAYAVDQKKRDAILVLQAVAELLERDGPHRAAFEMQYTARLDELLDRDISLDLCDGNRLTMETLVGHARQSRMDFAEVNDRAAVSRLLLKFAQQLGIRITQPEHLLGREEFCRRRGLNTPDHIDEWMRKNLLTAQEFDLMVEEYLLIQKVKMVCGPDNRDVIRQLRLEGAYAETVAAALKAHDDI